MIYPDTSFLIPVFTPEPQSVRVWNYLNGATAGLCFTPFHRLEFRTALRVRVFRQTLTMDQLRSALRESDRRLLSGLLRHTPLPWSDAVREAERLGEAHLTEIGTRAGDLLHVASAMVLQAREFVTFDQRQVLLAQRAGLKVKTWKVA